MIRRVIDMRTGLTHMRRSPEDGRFITRREAALEALKDDEAFKVIEPWLLHRWIWRRQRYE